MANPETSTKFPASIWQASRSTPAYWYGLSETDHDPVVGEHFVAAKTVESVGQALHAGTVQWCSIYFDWLGGRQRVGAVVVEWRFLRRFGWRQTTRIMVRHYSPKNRLVPTAEYEVAMAYSTITKGGRRWWFRCPKCERRVDLLYIVPPRSVLVCRKCGPLKYASQRTREAVSQRRERGCRKTVALLKEWPRKSKSSCHKP